MIKLRSVDFKYIFTGFIFAVFLVVWYAVFVENRSGLEVDFLDVGQGDAIFIQAENGNQLLLDGGENKKVLRKLAEVMPFYDHSVDILVLSHSHSDHIGGLVEVLKKYKVGMVIEPCLEADAPEYHEWRKLIEEKKITRVCAGRGQSVCLDENTCMEIILPVGDVAGRKEHDAMLVAKLVYGNTSFLFTGDMEKNFEQYLVGLMGKNLKSDVLKVGHHGSDTSTSELFLGFVSPNYAVISVGKDNKFGHPKQGVIDLLEMFSASVFRTDETGIIKIKSDGESVNVAF